MRDEVSELTATAIIDSSTAVVTLLDASIFNRCGELFCMFMDGSGVIRDFGEALACATSAAGSPRFSLISTQSDGIPASWRPLKLGTSPAAFSGIDRSTSSTNSGGMFAEVVSLTAISSSEVFHGVDVELGATSIADELLPKLSEASTGCDRL